MKVDQTQVEKINEFRKQFKYKYVGGGYFRDMAVPKGITADTKHGDEIINKFCEDLVKYLTDGHAT
jgi:hypothetical protein